MNEDILKLLQTRKNPINSMQDLHKRLIGTREGFIFYTTDFRKDFDTKIAMLGHLEQENQKLKDRDLIIAAELTKLQDENKQLKDEIEEYKNPIKYFKYANKNVTEENKTLKENAEHNDKVVDKVNWENMLLKKENKKLKDLIDTILNFSFFKEECPLNFGFENNTNEDKSQSIFYEDEWCENNCNDNYKYCWLKYFKKLQELEGSDE